MTPEVIRKPPSKKIHHCLSGAISREKRFHVAFKEVAGNAL